MNRLFKSALAYINANISDFEAVGMPFNRRSYLLNLIQHMANKELAELYREQLADLTDEQLREVRAV